MAAKEQASEARKAWNEHVRKLRGPMLYNSDLHALWYLAEEVFRIYDTATAGNEQRSTPTYIADCATAIDFRGTEWKYSEANDTWCLYGEGRVSHTSARSWQKLNYVFGPLKLKDD